MAKVTRTLEQGVWSIKLGTESVIGRPYDIHCWCKVDVCTLATESLFPSHFVVPYKVTSWTSDWNSLDAAEGNNNNGKGSHNTRMERQYNLHHGVRVKSHHIEDPVCIRNYRRGQQKWIPAQVKNRYGRVLYDVLTEDEQFWRRHINQMRTRSQRSATDQA
ncbi:unnamed protein product [Haemonchus placei]|uniref:Agenet domain-containing protein n=1 Tax=Haemonchus placei TaxID=6290 RepID=A0A0N4WWI1_HAEPC|nr:unnamed protein product [Haemonchus placei]